MMIVSLDIFFTTTGSCGCDVLRWPERYMYLFAYEKLLLRDLTVHRLQMRTSPALRSQGPPPGTKPGVTAGPVVDHKPMPLKTGSDCRGA